MRALKMICLGITVLCFMAAVPWAADAQSKEQEFTDLVCKKTGYPTGPGVFPTVCPPGKEIVKKGTVATKTNVVQDKDAFLCYPPCPSGFKGVGPVCWKSCPSGYHDDGAVCRKDAHIFGKDSYERGVGIVKQDAQHTSYEAGLWYVPCRKGYSGAATRCYQYCPSGYRDDGATCRRDVHIFGKQTATRGAGTPPTLCPSDQYLIEGQCYRNCKTGYEAYAFLGFGKCKKSCSGATKANGKNVVSVECLDDYCATTSAVCFEFKPRAKANRAQLKDCQ